MSCDSLDTFLLKLQRKTHETIESRRMEIKVKVRDRQDRTCTQRESGKKGKEVLSLLLLRKKEMRNAQGGTDNRSIRQTLPLSLSLSLLYLPLSFFSSVPFIAKCVWAKKGILLFSSITTKREKEKAPLFTSWSVLHFEICRFLLLLFLCEVLCGERRKLGLHLFFLNTQKCNSFLKGKARGAPKAGRISVSFIAWVCNREEINPREAKKKL